MTQLGNGLSDASHYEESLSVREAELSLLRRVCESQVTEVRILSVQNNLANTYVHLGRFEDVLRVRKEVYSGFLRISGEQGVATLQAAGNYADSLHRLQPGEAKTFLRRMLPVARRALGEGHAITIKMRGCYAEALYNSGNPSLDDLRESATTFEDLARTTRRVYGGTHPLTAHIERHLQLARAALRARETQP